MKAVIYTQYGPPEVLQLVEKAKPTPAADEVLVRIRASSINSRDWRLMRASPFFVRFMLGGVFRPVKQILGIDLAGVVEAVGSQVRRFQPGDAVFGYISNERGSAFAEYACVPEDDLTWKPAPLTFEQAAAVPLAALTALAGLEHFGRPQAGQKVLIQGASGGVGLFAVQIAKALGAEVTAVCSPRNIDLVRSLGAGQVIDYTAEDFTRRPERYDLILAVNGYHPVKDYLRALKPQGCFVVAGGWMRQVFGTMLWSRLHKHDNQKTAVVSLGQNQPGLIFVRELTEAGKIQPFLDACYPLESIVQAMRHYENLHPQGKIAISIGA